MEKQISEKRNMLKGSFGGSISPKNTSIVMIMKTDSRNPGITNTFPSEASFSTLHKRAIKVLIRSSKTIGTSISPIMSAVIANAKNPIIPQNNGYLKNMFFFFCGILNSNCLPFWSRLKALVKLCISVTSNYRFNISILIVSGIRTLFKGITGIILCLLLSILVNTPSYAANTIPQSTYLLKQYIRIVEYQNHIPGGLLGAIIEVESGFNLYAVNIEGKPIIVSNRAEAIHTIKNALNAGITNIDVGLAQINYRWHGDNFKGIEEMLNPITNIEYAGKLLSSLFKAHGDWFKALKYYHSAKVQHQLPYSRKIFVAWLGDGNYSTKF